jgi:hypothetical protein
VTEAPFFNPAEGTKASCGSQYSILTLLASIFSKVAKASDDPAGE